MSGFCWQLVTTELSEQQHYILLCMFLCAANWTLLPPKLLLELAEDQCLHISFFPLQSGNLII